MILTTVDFPAPFGPSKPKAWPGSRAKVTPSTAHGSWWRYRLRNPSTLTTPAIGEPNIRCVVTLDLQQHRTLTWAGLAVVLTAFDGSVLVLALPAIASDFHARTPALSNLGSVLALGALGALPLAALADRFGRRRLVAIGVAGSSIANFASGSAPSLEALALLRLVAVCFEVLVGGVATALIVEEAPAARRGQAVSVLALLAAAGTGITVISYPLLAPHWRWLFLAGGVGVVLAPAIWLKLPEGRTWLSARVSGSALRLLLQPDWRRRVIVIAAMTMTLRRQSGCSRRRRAEPLTLALSHVLPSGSLSQIAGASTTPTPPARNSHLQCGASSG